MEHIPLETCPDCKGRGWGKGLDECEGRGPYHKQGSCETCPHDYLACDSCESCHGHGYVRGCKGYQVQVSDGQGGWRKKDAWICDKDCPVDQLKKARAKVLGHYLDIIRVTLLKDPRLRPNEAWRDNKTGEAVYVDHVGYSTCGCGQRHGPHVYLYREGEGEWFKGIPPEDLIRDYTHFVDKRPLWQRKVRRRMYRPVYALPLVSIQPMSQPGSGALMDFYLSSKLFGDSIVTEPAFGLGPDTEED